MSDRAEPDLPQEPADSAKTKGSKDAETRSTQEISVPILEVHAPHEALHTWKGFFIHMATIVIGLLIAVGIEQTIEYFHHRHLREQLEAQMQEVFAGDLRSDASSIEQLSQLRAYLLEIRAAVTGRLDGKQEPLSPPANDPRMVLFLIFPNIAPYEAAKENGTVAYLSTARIRIYNRVAFQRELAAIDLEHWFEGLAALAAFNERYTDSTGNIEMGGVTTGPDITKLSRPELVEYLGVVATLIKKSDLMVDRYRLFDRECRAILAGVRDEDALIRAMSPGRTKESYSAAPTPLPK
jgi:hypothetical protein